MRVLFLNQYFPPDPAPTGVLFREIADELARCGHTADFVDAGQDYRAAQVKGGRMKREMAALRRMLREGKLRERADVVVSGTSPPCLVVMADRVARRHRARHIHWAMDVYPEIAIALGEVRAGSLLAKFTGWLAGRAYRRCAHVVALDADMADVLSRHRVEPVCIRPWVFKSILDQPQPDAAPDAEWTWIYSGNLGRAHDFETLLGAQQILEARGVDARLVFQGGGPGWPLAKARATALGLRRCEFRDYAPEGELRSSLLRCHALAITQRPETRGLLWPSKLGLATTLPRPLIFIGPDGAIAEELHRLSHAGVFPPGDAEGVAAWVADARTNPRLISPPDDPASRRAEALVEWMRLLGAA